MRNYLRRALKKAVRTSSRLLSRQPRLSALKLEQLEDRLTPSSVFPFSQPPVLDLLPAYASDRINVVMRSPVGSTAAAQVLASSPYAQTVEYLGLGIYSVHLKAGVSPLTAVAYYSTRPYAVTASVDNYVSIQRDPNDPQYSSQWDMTKIGAPIAWDVTTGMPKFVVGVVDTGIDYNHQDLFMNIWINNAEIPTSIRNTLTDADGDGVITFRDLNHSSNSGKVTDNNGNGVIDPADIFRSTSQGGWLDGVDQDSNGYVDDLFGWDFANNDNDPMDDNNHGTHVAGTIGAVGNNGVGVTGINWSLSLMALKFLDSSGNGLVSRAVMAIDYATTKGVKLTNHSWGGANYSASLAAAISRARDAGHIIVAAAGNSGQNLDSSPQYPASYSTSYNNVITVASVNSSDQLASSSNYGANTVTLAAPGVSILSTVRNNGYSYFSGTSMAAPHVTGAIALYWASNPTLSYTQVIDKLKASVDPISGLSGKVLTGGRLNVGKMFDSTTPSGPKVVDAQWGGLEPFTLDRLRVTFDKAINVNTFTSGDIVSFVGPGGSISTSYQITAVSGGGNKVFDIVFGVQRGAGRYELVLGPQIEDERGNRMNQDGDGVNGEDPGDRYVASVELGESGPRVVDAQFRGSNPRMFDSVRLTFSEPIKPSSFTEDDIVEFTGPNGTISTSYTIVPVNGSNDTQFDILFAKQNRQGTYRMTVGPFIEDSLGNYMNQNGDHINGQIPEDRFILEQYLDTSKTKRYDAWKVNRPIRDYRVTRSAITITEAITISDLSVRVNLNHSATGDLRIRLIGPQNQSVVLFDRHGKNGDNLRNTWFSDSADISISQGKPPYNGNYRSIQSLSMFHNSLAAGKWILEVRDTKSGHVGKLLSWSLVVTGTMEDGEGGGMGGMMSAFDNSACVWPVYYLPPSASNGDHSEEWNWADPIEVG
jgi:subtilisin family serine protease/subtilisin-like proprotein convertase family protein